MNQNIIDRPAKQSVMFPVSRRQDIVLLAQSHPLRAWHAINIPQPKPTTAYTLCRVTQTVHGHIVRIRRAPKARSIPLPKHAVTFPLYDALTRSERRPILTSIWLSIDPPYFTCPRRAAYFLAGKIGCRPDDLVLV